MRLGERAREMAQADAALDDLRRQIATLTTERDAATQKIAALEAAAATDVDDDDEDGEAWLT
jgi:hypothetical protein